MKLEHERNVVAAVVSTAEQRHATGNMPLIDKGERIVDVLFESFLQTEPCVSGEMTCIAVRDIHPGEELTQDCGMTDEDDYAVRCDCGRPACRKIVIGRPATRGSAEASWSLF